MGHRSRASEQLGVERTGKTVENMEVRRRRKQRPQRGGVIEWGDDNIH